MKCHIEFEINLNTGRIFLSFDTEKKVYDFEKPLA